MRARHAHVLQVPGSSIAGVTLGSARRMLFQSKTRGASGRKPVTTIVPEDGSLYVMRHPTNKNFKHSVPKARKSETPKSRVSLTFRAMRQASSLATVAAATR